MTRLSSLPEYCIFFRVGITAGGHAADRNICGGRVPLPLGPRRGPGRPQLGHDGPHGPISSSREPPDTHEMRRHISAEHRTHRGMLVWPSKAAPGDEEGEGDDSEDDKEGDALAVDPMQGFLMFTSKGAMDPAFMCSSFMYAFRPAAAPAAGSVHGGHPQDLAWMGDKMHIVSG